MRAWCAAVLVCACAEPPIARTTYFEEVGLAYERINGELTVPERISGGVCAIDADGAPPLDLFFAGGARLFVASEPWQYTDETSARGVEVGEAIGCLTVDGDGDGDDDLLVTGTGALWWLEQDAGRFVDRGDLLDVVIPASHVFTSATAADYDGDGDLELAIGGFIDLDHGRDGECGGIPCALDLEDAVPVPSLLLMRGADGRYTNVASELAPELAIAEPTLVLGSPDVDGDGRPELYRGNDFGARFHDRVLSRGEDGVLRDAADRLGLAYDAGGNGVDTMGWTTGDVDGDGRFDHAVTAFDGFHSPLFVCGADGFCEDSGRARGMRAVRHTFRWGNALADFDRDGDLDLFEATGHLYTEEEGRAAGIELVNAQAPNLLVNRGDGAFDLVRPRDDDALVVRRPARGISVVDLDDDGRLDVVLGVTRGAPGLLRNVTAGGHWLRVVLRGRAPNTGAIGALVRVISADATRMRQRLAGEGFLGSFDPRLHFGLPSAGEVDVEIRWPSGTTSVVRSVDVDRELVAEEP